jgi:hypothetical protein
MAASAGKINVGFESFDIQLEMREPECASSLTASKPTTDSIEGTAVDEKLCKEQRREMVDQLAGGSTSQYADEPPSYSVFVIGGGTPLDQRPDDNKLGPAAKTKTVLHSTGVNCRGCQAKKRIDRECDEDDRKSCSDDTDAVTEQNNVDSELLEAKAWRQFTSNTTMHGIKYVFEDRPFTMRR